MISEVKCARLMTIVEDCGCLDARSAHEVSCGPLAFFNSWK